MPETTDNLTFKKGQFNFARGWKEWAEPAYDSLGPDLRSLVADVEMCAADLRQGPDLEMPWPTDVALRGRFEREPSENLATASRIAYFYGHWATAHWIQTHGTYWKFSNYADQVLASRLDIDRNSYISRRNGASLSVLEGALRVCLSTPYSWQWTEVGLATTEVRERLVSLLSAERVPGVKVNGWEFLRLEGIRGRSGWDSWSDNCHALLERLAP